MKAWFLRICEFSINFTALVILLGIPNDVKSNDITNLNFVMLFAKQYIYTSKKNRIPIDFYNFQVKLKTRMIIEEYKYTMYNRSLEFMKSGRLWLIVCNNHIGLFYVSYDMCVQLLFLIMYVYFKSMSHLCVELLGWCHYCVVHDE